MPVKHKRKRNRLYNFDYSNNGLYFVTICTENRDHLFGGVYNDFMCVNKLGTILYQQWQWLFEQYKYIKNHGFIVMPNHVHGIVEIDRWMVGDESDKNVIGGLDDMLDSHGRDRSRPVPTDVGNNPNILIQNKSDKKTKIKSISELIGAFKTTSSKIIHQQYLPRFAWQRSFHDHIIRNEKEYAQIYKYVQMNPVLWNRDRNNI